ncbi:MAG: HD domain-containing phosphohydrolase [Phycisphaerales bacterium]
MSPRHIRDLVRAVERRDAVTAAHTWRVVLYARLVAGALGADHDFIRRFSVAAALHDVGKLDIPARILRKPGALTARERAIMQRHAPRGERRLARMGERDGLVLSLVRSHHERWDGGGYPDGLGGEAIPEHARYFAVVDSFDAMTGRRPYRAPGPEPAARALAELRAGAGAAYWGPAVDLFARLCESGRLRWVLDLFDGRCPVAPFSCPGGAEALERRARRACA